MKQSLFVVALGCVALVVGAACGSNRDGFDNGTSSGSSNGGPNPELGKDKPGDAGPPQSIGTLTGKVVMPEGTIPLSDALVYLTSERPGPIPKEAYCDKCVALDSFAFTYSKPDGTFELPAYQAGTQWLVVQKGQFRRFRSIEVKTGTQTVPQPLTTLPGMTNDDVGDTTPRMLLMPGQWDHIDKSLKKIGVTDFEKFEPGLNLSAYDAKLKEFPKYHIIFFPCTGTVNSNGGSGPACSVSVDPKMRDAAKDFVARGGKLYVSDWSYEYVRQGWPGAVSWVGETSTIGSGCQPGGADSPAQFDDKSLNDWMSAIGEGNATLKAAWSTIASVKPFPSLDENGKSFTQTPKVWASVKQASGTHPATVSFQDRCGRVLYSTYHAEGSDSVFGQGDFLAQEKALMHILLEVGVCVGQKPIPPVK
jgi:hypothetical protein